MEKPPEYILIPIGEYNGVDLPDIWVDENYIVWIEIENPELDCEVIYDNCVSFLFYVCQIDT